MSERGPDRFEAYILDLDGTVYIGEDLIPGAAETVAALRARGAQVAFVTNNPLRPAGAYAAKLTRLGIPTEPDDVITSVDALTSYLGEHHPAKSVLPIAEAEVERAVTEAGFPVVNDPEEADLVVVSFDRTFSYVKLHAAFRAVRERAAPIVATNPDPFCPTPDGGLPDCAAMLAAPEACTCARAEAIVGKPSRHMINTVLRRLSVRPDQTAVVGDRPATDVAMGQAIGATGILVLSGATSAAEAESSDVRPDRVLRSISALVA